MTGIRVSIAMCTYNGADYVQEQLESIGAQHRKPDELVVVDDGSVDGTPDIVRAFAKSAPFPVRLSVNDVTLGSTKNFERAIQRCEGNIIALADQDDVWKPHKLSAIENAFVRDDAVGMVFSNAEVVDQQLEPVGYGLWRTVKFGDEAQKRFTNNQALAVLLKRNVVTGATMAFRARFKAAIFPFPDTSPQLWVHDSWISLVIACLAPVGFISAPLIYYRQHANNQIGARQVGVWRDLLESRKRDASYRQQLLRQHRIILEHMNGLNSQGDQVASRALRMLKDKERHLEARATMADKMRPKLEVIFKETTNRRYFRYSGGHKSILKDLLSG